MRSAAQGNRAGKGWRHSSTFGANRVLFSGSRSTVCHAKVVAGSAKPAPEADRATLCIPFAAVTIFATAMFAGCVRYSSPTFYVCRVHSISTWKIERWRSDCAKRDSNSFGVSLTRVTQFPLCRRHGDDKNLGGPAAPDGPFQTAAAAPCVFDFTRDATVIMLAVDTTEGIFLDHLPRGGLVHRC
jgi:hypothetical protein